MGISDVLTVINYVIAALFALCYLYQVIYVPVALFSKKKHSGEEKTHNFAVLVCARNEKNVIAELIDSIREQTYPQENLTVFVMADNCTDETAELARCAGAVVYERQNKEKVGKGYALDALLCHIREDYGDIFDGYFVFDADNILKSDYIEQMNKTFSSGYDIVTSYRNSKNFGDNWVSAGYGFWFLRESQYLNRARHALGTSCAISGTGFMFSRRILEKNNGWPYSLLTEDIEFTVSQILDGEKIGYCEDAVFYDEQPTKFTQSWRQRMRWTKGYLQVFTSYGARLWKKMFRLNFACYDMTMSTIPAMILTIAGVVLSILKSVFDFINGKDITWALLAILISILNTYFVFFLMGVITVISERKRIDMPWYKKILYSFTFPIFMLTYLPLSLAAVFAKVTWSPIEHHSVKNKKK